MRSRHMRQLRPCVASRQQADSCQSAPTGGTRRMRDSRPSKRCCVSRNSRAPLTTIHRRSRHGFTLIELLVTIAIIATLAAIVAPALFGNVGTARQNAARSQIQILSLALDGFRVDNDTYPSSE